VGEWYSRESVVETVKLRRGLLHFFMVKNIIPIEYTTVDFDPFAGPEIAALAPATESQKEIMISCLLGGDAANAAFNESISLRLSGNVNKEALEKALHDLTDRHDALRSAFSGDGKQICIFNNSYSKLDYKDISDFHAEEQREILSDQAHREVSRVFDLLNGPLFRMKLLKLSHNEFYLTITAHHIICDGWSLNIILQELSRLYSGYVQNTFVDLPAAVPFSAFANEQHAFYESDEYKQIENYWINQYKDDAPVLNLATDFPRQVSRTYKSKRLDCEVRPDLVCALKKLSNKSGCSFITTLIASFEVFLHRLTGQQTFVIGLPAAGQAATGNYNLVGHCVNLLPLKTVVNSNCSFKDYLKLCKKDVLEALEQQRFSFGSLLKKINIPRDSSRVALVPVVFNVEMGMNDGVSFYGLTYDLISNPREFETFELFLNISGSEKSSLTFEWSYNTQLFRQETIQKMMEGFSNVLETVVQDPLIKIENIQLPGTKDLFDKISEGNATEVAYDNNIPVHHLIDKAAAKFPGNTALIFKDKKLSYKTLNDTANQLAHSLIQQGIKAGDLVGVALDRSPEMVISLLAVMKSGAAYIPIDPEYPADRIQFMLHDSSAKMLVSSAFYKGKFNAGITEFLIGNGLPGLESFSKNAPDVQVYGNDLVYILYTSGSTGRPKGVLLEHRSLVNLLLSMVKMPGINEHDTLLAVTTVSFDIAALEIFLPLITGATILLAEAETAKDGRELLQIVKEQPVTIMQATPATYKMMLAAGWEQPLSLKILCGGEPMTKDLADKLCIRGAAVYNMYGPTETAIYSTGKQVNINDDIITIGRPINNTLIYILDESLNPVPNGVAGEIYIAGAGVARGYVNMPGLTEEKFITNPFTTPGAEKMYRTGDLGKFFNGEIQFLGRIDRQIKVRGYRIEPGEIENAIMKHGGFKETLVMTCLDKKSNQRLTAFIVPETHVNEEQFSAIILKLKERLKNILPAYMLPDQFIKIEKLPLLINGKIDFNALSDLCVHNRAARDKTALPSAKTERLLISIWSEFLCSEDIDVNDNFFELGGHSLIAVEVMMRIEKETGIKLPLSTLFEYPTIKKLAFLLQADKDLPAVYKSLVPIKPSGGKMPVYIIHGSGLNVLNFSSIALHVDAEQPVYGLQAKGLNGTDEPLNSMEEIAAYHISQVLEHNPEGPYAIAGYSFGGYVGIEMARQLRLMGKKVKMLAMFDTNAEVQDYEYGLLNKVSAKATRQLRKLLWVSTSLLKQPKTTMLYQLKYIRNKIKAISAPLYQPARTEPQNPLTEFDRISKQHDIAYRNYRMKPFDGTIDLFKAKTRIYFVDDFKFLGWKKYAKGVRVHEVPGDHKTMLLRPNDKKFARALQNALDNC